jgi:NAD(P)-dependent dehydrogenase (short-subunit alcohol dehydrogenase family)
VGRLEGRVGLVTGSARGLGAGIARSLAQEGAFVVCADLLDARETASSLPGAGGSAIVLDVTRPDDVDSAVADIIARHGGVDIVANNAGVAQPIGTFLETTDETIARVLDVNVKGVIHCSRAAGRAMIDRGQGGRIINTASQAGKCAWPNWGIYSASKAAVISITQAMALELAPHRITVNAVCPGTMETDMTYTGFGQAAESVGTPRDALIAQHAQTIPLSRLGTPEDMGLMCAWIASDECRFTTGAAFNLTGGESVFF